MNVGGALIFSLVIVLAAALIVARLSRPRRVRVTCNLWPASVDTDPQGRDAKLARCASIGSAVAVEDGQTPKGFRP